MKIKFFNHPNKKLKFSKLNLAFVLIVLFHILWMNIIPKQIVHEIAFPTSFLTVTKKFVSEDHFLHPSFTYYAISFLARHIGNLELSITIIQNLFIMIIDTVLFTFLRKRFNSNYALVGLTAFIPFQIFFRGNALWFDLLTVPFLILSYSYFLEFLKTENKKHLLQSSIVLALGYFFKQTVIFTLFLFLAFIIVIFIRNPRKLLQYGLLLISPLIASILINSSALLIFAPFQAVFEWSFIIPLFIFSRLPTYSRFISGDYLPIIGIMLIFLLASFNIICKNHFIKKRERFLLFSATLLNLNNLFPWWSDLRMQPFVALFIISTIYGIASVKTVNKNIKTQYILIAVIFTSCFLAFIINRFKSEYIKPSNKNVVETSAPSKIISLFRDKNVFAYDSSLNHDTPLDSGNIHFLEKIHLIIFNPNKYFRSVSPNIALAYIKKAHPDTVIIPVKIKNRIKESTNLTPVEIFLKENNSSDFQISSIYWAYEMRYKQ